MMLLNIYNSRSANNKANHSNTNPQSLIDQVKSCSNQKIDQKGQHAKKDQIFQYNSLQWQSQFDIGAKPLVDKIDQELCFVQLLHTVELLDVFRFVELFIQIFSFTLLFRCAKQRNCLETMTNKHLTVFLFLASINNTKENFFCFFTEGIRSAGQFCVK